MLKNRQWKNMDSKNARSHTICFYYLCIAKGVLVIYIGEGIFVQHWEDDDPRIHKRPNCRYRSDDTVTDILFDMIQDGFVVKKPF